MLGLLNINVGKKVLQISFQILVLFIVFFTYPNNTFAFNETEGQFVRKYFQESSAVEYVTTDSTPLFLLNLTSGEKYVLEILDGEQNFVANYNLFAKNNFEILELENGLESGDYFLKLKSSRGKVIDELKLKINKDFILDANLSITNLFKTEVYINGQSENYNLGSFILDTENLLLGNSKKNIEIYLFLIKDGQITIFNKASWNNKKFKFNLSNLLGEGSYQIYLVGKDNNGIVSNSLSAKFELFSLESLSKAALNVQVSKIDVPLYLLFLSFASFSGIPILLAKRLKKFWRKKV